MKNTQKLKDLYIRLLSWEYVFHVVKGRGLEYIGPDLKTPRSIQRPALVDENWRGWRVDWLIKPKLPLVTESRTSHTSFLWLLERLEGVGAWKYKTPSQFLSNHFRESPLLLKSLSPNDPKLHYENVINLLWCFADSAEQVDKNTIEFKWEGLTYILTNEYLMQEGTHHRYYLPEYKWVRHFTQPRKVCCRVSNLLYQVNSIAGRPQYKDETGLQRLADTLMYVGDHKYLEFLATRKPRFFYRDKWDTWEFYARTFGNPNPVEFVKENLDVTDLDESKFNRLYEAYATTATSWGVKERVAFMNMLAQSFDITKVRKPNVISFYRKSWEW